MGDTSTPLVLGTMTWGREADKPTARAMFERALDAGVTTFDTAPIYGEGNAERWLGEFVRESGRDDLRVFTKVGYHPQRFGGEADIKASIEAMGGVEPDIVFAHRPCGSISWPRVGLSNHAAWEMAIQLSDCAAIVACSPMYSLLKRQAEAEILPLAQNAELEVYPYSPLAAGLLTGKYTAWKPQVGRLVEDERYARRYVMHDSAPRQFCRLAERFELHPATLAIAWVAAHPAVTAPIIGARNVEQLEPCLAAADVKLTQKQYDAVSALTPAPCATDRDEERERVVVA